MYLKRLKELLAAQQRRDPRELEFLSLKHAHERGVTWLALPAARVLLIIGLVLVVLLNIIRVMLR